MAVKHPANPWPGGFWSWYCCKIIISKKSILPGRSFSWLLGLEILFVLVFFGSTCELWILLVRNKTGCHMGDRFQRLKMQKSCAPTWEVLPTTWNTFLFCWNLLMARPAGCYDVWCLAKMIGYWTPDHFIFYQECFTGWNTVFPWCNYIFAISQLFAVFGDLALVVIFFPPFEATGLDLLPFLLVFGPLVLLGFCLFFEAGPS